MHAICRFSEEPDLKDCVRRVSLKCDPVKWGGFLIEPGDWIVADDDGVIHLPKSQAVEMANRAQDVLEKENRVRHEIDADGRTLAQVMELYKWEKK